MSVIFMDLFVCLFVEWVLMGYMPIGSFPFAAHDAIFRVTNSFARWIRGSGVFL